VRRIRLVFLVLAAALLVPTGLLVRRALESVEVERAARHRTVAERVFDEMERSLSEFLAREEERPFGHYRFYYTPDAAVIGVGALARSPLAAPPDRDFVVGYFQMDPDGSLHSPLRPRDEAAARAAGDYRPTPAVERSVEATLQLVSAYWAARPRSAPARPAPSIGEQAPGTTVPLLDTREEGEAERAAVLEKEEHREAELRKEVLGSAYDAIQSLNRGAQLRASRSQKVMEVERPAAPRPMAQSESPEAMGKGVPEAMGKGVPEAMEEAAPQSPAVGDERGRWSAAEGHAERDAGVAVGGARAGVPAPRRSETVRVALDPLIGRIIDEGHLLLYRTVLVDDRGYRQGLVIDVPGLIEFLRRETLGDGALPRARLDFTTKPEGAIPGDGGGGYAYRHRFAEPFDDLTVALRLGPLADVSGAGSVYLLSILLLLAASAGLFALYRMVGVTVRFAERRNNFVAAVSHELKTPLTAIRMYAEMLRDGIVPSERKRQEYYGTITSESQRLSRLINNVLEFSRLEKGNRQMNLVAGSLGPVVEEMAELLRPHAEHEGFTLEVVSDPGDLQPGGQRHQVREGRTAAAHLARVSASRRRGGGVGPRPRSWRRAAASHPALRTLLPRRDRAHPTHQGNRDRSRPGEGPGGADGCGNLRPQCRRRRLRGEHRLPRRPGLTPRLETFLRVAGARRGGEPFK
jgi:signal transduction histidine kinase